jgi:hypothetical protein
MNLRVSYTTWQEAIRAIVTQLLTMFARARDWTGIQSFTNGISVGGGATITKIITATATLDFPSVGSNGIAELTITVTGAAAGDTVMLAAPAAFEAGFTFVGFVSAANTVTVRIHNNNGGAVDPASAAWRATVLSYA